MLKPVINPMFFLFCTIYLLVHIGRFLQLGFPIWLNGYLTDLLCMPMVLALSLVGVRWIKKIPDYILNIRLIIAMTIFYSVYFEMYLPSISSKYTADIIDVSMYFIGAIVYWFFYQPYYALSKVT